MQNVKVGDRVVTDYVGCEYITAGKLYAVVEVSYILLVICDNDGDRIHICIDRPAAHLNGGVFKLVRDPE